MIKRDHFHSFIDPNTLPVAYRYTHNNKLNSLIFNDNNLTLLAFYLKKLYHQQFN